MTTVRPSSALRPSQSEPRAHRLARHDAAGARATSLGRRVETWLWTGPFGHLLGGGLDFGHALGHYLLARASGRTVR